MISDTVNQKVAYFLIKNLKNKRKHLNQIFTSASKQIDSI